MMQVRLKMIDFHYTVIRRARRKTATISVSRDNKVCIAVPKNLSRERIEEIIQRRAGWIRAKIKFNQETACLHHPKRFVSGESFLFLGENYPLRVVEGSSCGADLKEGCLSVRVAQGLECRAREGLVAIHLKDWYVSKAMEKIRERVDHYGRRLEAKPLKVVIKDLKSRWGSCSSKGSLSFCWRLVMAPPEVLDYVVLHEMCHLVELNHSARFWDLVRAVMPEFKAHQDWLKVKGATLDW
jgi:predicted metal-dependent hydrolase